MIRPSTITGEALYAWRFLGSSVVAWVVPVAASRLTTFPLSVQTTIRPSLTAGVGTSAPRSVRAQATCEPVTFPVPPRRMAVSDSPRA